MFDKQYWSDLDSLHKFYCLGFILCDGSVFTKGKYNKLMIELADVDEEFLERMKEELTIDTKPYKRDRRPIVNTSTCTIHKNCKEWITDLDKYGVHPNKQFDVRIPLEYIDTKEKASALMLGMLDADGCVYNRPDSDQQAISLSKNLGICEQYRDLLVEYTGVHERPVHKVGKTNCYQLTYMRREDISKIYDFLYMNECLRDIWMGRKYNAWRNQ